MRLMPLSDVYHPESEHKGLKTPSDAAAVDFMVAQSRRGARGASKSEPVTDGLGERNGERGRRKTLGRGRWGQQHMHECHVKSIDSNLSLATAVVVHLLMSSAN